MSNHQSAIRIGNSHIAIVAARDCAADLDGMHIISGRIRNRIDPRSVQRYRSITGVQIQQRCRIDVAVGRNAVTGCHVDGAGAQSARHAAIAVEQRID